MRRRAPSPADVLVRSAVHLAHHDFPDSQYRRTFRDRRPDRRIRAYTVDSRINPRARVCGAEKRELSHRASLLSKRPVLSAPATASHPDVQSGIQGFSARNPELSRRTTRMHAQRGIIFIFVLAQRIARPNRATRPTLDLSEQRK